MTQAPDNAQEEVERLAKMLTSPPISMSGYGDDVAKCADAMLALSARLAEVEAERDAFASELPDSAQNLIRNAMRQRKLTLARAEAAEARNKELEAKLAQGIVAEYDDGSRVSLSAYAGGASEGGAWSHLTLMKEEQDGAASFRHYTADGDWCSPLVFSDPAELKGEKDA